jgi:hypothetical protein
MFWSYQPFLDSLNSPTIYSRFMEDGMQRNLRRAISSAVGRPQFDSTIAINGDRVESTSPDWNFICKICSTRVGTVGSTAHLPSHQSKSPPKPIFLVRDFNAWSLSAALSLTNHWVIKKWREYGSHFTTFSRERCFYEYRHGEFVSR